MLYKESERTSDYFMEINDGDISSIDMPFSNWPKNHWLRGAGVSTSTENASTLTGLASYFCIAPGKAPGQGESGTEQSQLLVRNQLELNQIIGNMYARMNSPYGQYSVTLAHTAWIGMDPAYMKWLRVTIAANSATNRGITLNSDRFLINEVNIAFQPEGGYREVTMNLEREVDEMTATTVIPPEVANIPSTVTGNPVNYEVITNSWGEEDTTFIPGHAIIVAVPNIVLLVNNIGGGSLDVVDISPASMPGYPAMGILDPYNYDRLIVLCENGIIACDDIRAVTPTWSTVYTPDTLTYNLAWVIRGSNTREGYFCWSGYAIGAGNYYRFFYTTDNFATVNMVTIDAGMSADSMCYASVTACGSFVLGSGIAMGSYNSGGTGHIWVNSGYHQNIWHSDDWGQTWTDTTLTGMGPIDLPFTKSDGSANTTNDDLTYYYVDSLGDPFQMFVDATEYDDAGAGYDIINSAQGFNSYTLNGGTKAAIAWQLDTPSSANFWRTTDNGVTWTRTTDTLLWDGSTDPLLAGINGWPTNPNFYIAFGTGFIAYTNDGGASWTDLYADLQPLISGVDTSEIVTAIADLSFVYPVGGIHPTV
jgi:hypothetical protein